MNTEQTTKKKSEYSTLEKWLIIFAIIFAILGVIIFIVTTILFNHNETYNINEKINSNKFGEFGSFVSGVVGAIWALVSVILFYITLRMQRKELGLQREELELTRNELKGQKIELERANSFSAIQQFDNKFFQMIGLHNEIRNEIFIDEVKNSYFNMENKSGVQFFQQLALMIAKRFYETKNIMGSELNEQKLNRVYQKAFHQYKAVLGHYFRNLFHIVRIVDENKLLNDNEKKDYIKILRSQLSQYELVLLSYNGIMPFGVKFYPLINKYELLKNIDFELWTPTNYHIKIVTPSILTSKYPHLIRVFEEQTRIFKENISVD
jgi:hypothetical protein